MNFWFRLAIALALVGAPAARATCSYAGATYTHTASRSWTIDFIPFGRHVFRSDMAMHMKDGESGAEYWFLYDEGSAPFINLISTTDVRAVGWQPPDPDGGVRPLRSMHVFAWNRDMMIQNEMPASQAQAPQIIFIPDLAEELWYGTRDPDRHRIAQGTFRRTACRSANR